MSAFWRVIVACCKCDNQETCFPYFSGKQKKAQTIAPK
jgi:hypothetical protein